LVSDRKILMKKIHLKILLLLFAWSWSQPGFAQVQNQAEQKWLQELVKTDVSEELFQLIEETQLLEELDLSKSVFPTGLIVPEYLGQQRLILPTKLQLQSVYNSFYPDSVGVPNFYSSIQIGTGIQVSDLPIKINGRLVWADQSIQTRLSSVSIDFDPIAFLKQHTPSKEEILSKLDGLHLSDKVNLPSLEGKQLVQLPKFNNLTERELAVVKKEVLFQVYQKICKCK